MIKKCLLALALAGGFVLASGAVDSSVLLSLTAPIASWDDALPLGNGRTGALVWGSGNELRLTLDRADYWHNSITDSYLRPDYNIPTLLDCVRRGDDKRRMEIFGLRTHSPTKLPGVRLTLTLAAKGSTNAVVLTRFQLDKNGTARVTVATPAGARDILCWFDDDDDCLSLRLPSELVIASKAFNRNPAFDKLGGYPEPVIKLDDTGAFYSRGPRAGAKGPMDHAFATGVRFVGPNAAPHSAFWPKFYAASSISIPDPDLQRQYDFTIYLYGAAARRGCAPLALQGLWTADNNSIPPWNGDYHNDMNTEMTYWAAGPAGCLEALEGFADFYLERLPLFRQFGRKMYASKDGAMITPTMGYTGDAISGWTAYNVLPEHGLWAYNTLTDAFDYAPTRDKAARYLAFGRELAAALEHAWTVTNGVRTLNISSSPEVDDNRLSCFFTSNTSYARSILNAFYLRLARLADYLGEKDEAAKWRGYVGTFGPASARNGVLEIAKGRLLNYSHRHPSHLMDLFPFPDTPRDANVDYGKSLDQYERLGTSQWVGFSFSWDGCCNARLGRGDRAYRYLKDFQRAFTSRCGFNLNGDQLKCGLSNLTYRPFTLDANFGFARGIQEMLLQYDAHTQTVTLFPALPACWDGEEVSFRDLRIPGGHRLSATRAANGKITYTLTPYPGSPVPQVKKAEIEPYGLLPTKGHLAYQKREMLALVCWGLNPYTNQEWGYGNVPVSKITADKLDPAQWAHALRAGELKSVVLVAKHHDGFCLWPSPLNPDYSMAAVPAPNTGRDLVRELADACRREGMGFGVYLSPWDRHQGTYATPAYVEYYHSQWLDLLTNYGEICEIWLDGANGGDGWYGGANGGKGERRSISKNYYDYPRLLRALAKYQPNAVAMGGHGARSVAWCGNESGWCPDTWWCPRPGSDGKDYWQPAETDTPFRGGWYFHAHERPKSLARLVKTYFESVGRGSVLDLGIAPDTHGQICPDDVKRLAEFGDYVRAFNRVDFAANASVAETRTNNTLTLELTLPKAVRFNCVDLRERIAYGQRVSAFAIAVWQNGAWKPAAKGTTIGSRRLARFAAVTTDRVRITLDGKAPPLMAPTAVRYAPPVNDPRARAWDVYPKQGWKVVFDSCPDTHLGQALIDGNPRTLWHSHGARGPQPAPQSIAIDCTKPLLMHGFDYLPRLDGCPHGLVDAYDFEVSTDGKTWTKVASGEFGNVKANPIRQRIAFTKPVTARYFRFTARHALYGRVAVAEIDIW